MKNKIWQQLKTIAPALLAGVFLGWLFFHSGEKGNSTETPVATEETHHHEEEAQIWTCSMHPQIQQDGPGQCPICGMDLIPLETESGDTTTQSPDEVTLSAAAMQLANIQTTVVQQGAAEKTIRLLGKVYPDERNISHLTARFGGRIEQLFVNFTGQQVRQGEKLGTIYSPQLINAQKELLETVKFKDTNPTFYQAARTKLKLWELTDEQIDAIENSGQPQLYFDIRSPITGTVTKREIASGNYVKEGDAMFEITNLTKVWLLFDAYESDLPWINKGDQVRFTLPALANKPFSGRISFIDPIIDNQTRVAHVRVEVRNTGLKYKPGMLVNGILEAKINNKTDRLLIPKSSILWTGKRSVVYVKIPERENPSFLLREIALGPEAGNFYIVTDGLKAGEEIATNGVFKIDAAAQLAGKRSMMSR